MNHREQILGSIRDALGRDSGSDPTELPPPAVRSSDASGREALVDRFIEEVEAVSGKVHRVAGVDAAAAVLEGLVRSEGIDRLAVSRDPLAREISARVLTGHEVIDPEDARDRIERAGMGLTGGRLAIAEHGTVMLAPEDDHGRLTALLPPHHVIVLGTDRVVGTLAEAIDALGDEPPATLTFVSGPSRTADIEQTLVLGIHGPARLDVLLIDSEGASS